MPYTRLNIGLIVFSIEYRHQRGFAGYAGQDRPGSICGGNGERAAAGYWSAVGICQYRAHSVTGVHTCAGHGAYSSPPFMYFDRERFFPSTSSGAMLWRPL